MTTIQLQISDELIRAYGLEALQQRLAKFLEWEQFYLSAKAIEGAVMEAGQDNDKLRNWLPICEAKAFKR